MSALPFTVGRYGRDTHTPEAEQTLCNQYAPAREAQADEEVIRQLVGKPGPATTAMLTQSEISRGSGYTGDGCPDCGNFTMKRNGSCLSCTTCGGTTGCS